MQQEYSIDDLFVSIDSKNIESFMNFLDDQCSFRFGNLPAATGIDNIRTFVAGFFDSISSLNHVISDSWPIPDGVICHGRVSYTRHDKSVLTVPFSNIFKINDNKILEYLIFADTSQLYSDQSR